jgi:hypothetical protein
LWASAIRALVGLGTIESAQAICAHESPVTAKLCDHTDNDITLVESDFDEFDSAFILTY